MGGGGLAVDEICECVGEFCDVGCEFIVLKGASGQLDVQYCDRLYMNFKDVNYSVESRSLRLGVGTCDKSITLYELSERIKSTQTHLFTKAVNFKNQQLTNKVRGKRCTSALTSVGPRLEGSLPRKSDKSSL